MIQAAIESGALVGDRGSYRLERPPDRLSVPATVQAVVAARIDRLPRMTSGSSKPRRSSARTSRSACSARS